ncbi:uncharacterized protein Tco025E_09294 [Trypanosoma conorhini]|uniref:Uncharacterized protein n=1 Tax=Trypanosoma conorhini TaxID=83891 RepID=A0A422MXX9_9TRYP|nr:uncharacterized protein Tco025E_09294 [Trypanosoma conorhini]RNE98104.1 hypothetical protein Tco025E_09294 [Trypanosoma conorhini]
MTPAARVCNFSRRSSADSEAVLRRATARRGSWGTHQRGSWAADAVFYIFGSHVLADTASTSISLVFATAKDSRACRPTPRNGWIKTAPRIAGGDPPPSGPLPRAVPCCP